MGPLCEACMLLVDSRNLEKEVREAERIGYLRALESATFEYFEPCYFYVRKKKEAKLQEHKTRDLSLVVCDEPVCTKVRDK